MRFVHESVIDAPVARVFAFHERPDALSLLTPPWQPLQLVQAAPSLQPGAKAILRLRIGPVWVDWVAEHTLYEKDALFQDVQRKGPFRRWEHTHRFAAEGAKTRLRDEVLLELPLGALALPAWPLIRRQLRRAFELRHAVTRAACVQP